MFLAVFLIIVGLGLYVYGDKVEFECTNVHGVREHESYADYVGTNGEIVLFKFAGFIVFTYGVINFIAASAGVAT